MLCNYSQKPLNVRVPLHGNGFEGEEELCYCEDAIIYLSIFFRDVSKVKHPVVLS